jgi:outer membrane translocation and assembly module TamA
MIAGQAEYRMQLLRRVGAVVFAGAGSVAATFGDLFRSTLLPDAGLGLRFLAVPSQGVNISVDYAWGRDGSSGLYVYIGDAF